jgi:thiol:disulfide interchange protein DsbC
MLKLLPVFTLVACAVFGAGVAATAAAAQPASATMPPAPAADPIAEQRAALMKILPASVKPEDLRPSPIPGMWQLAEGADISYITADGKFFMDGNIYDMKSRENLTEELRAHARVAMINAVPESEMLIFGPKNPQYTISVFTDVDCAYCRKLHSEMAELNRMGIRVRYMFFPRTGPDTESWKKAEVVWCSPDRNEALTRAKAGATLDLTKACAVTPVAREYALGQSLGVHGTPAIMTERGDYIAGYLPPKELLQQLKDLQLAKR